MPFWKQRQNSFSCALVTGGHSGLGKSISNLLQQKGIRVIALSSSNYDLKSKKGRKGVCSIISKEKPDLVINNAGLGYYGNATSNNIDDQLSIIEVNVLALAEITIHSAKTLKSANMKGTIFNVSSAAALVPFPFFSVYSASKLFVCSFSQSLDFELKKFGIRVLSALPGQISTSFRLRASRGILHTPNILSMSPEFAAKQIWKQLIKGKQQHIFCWLTRFFLKIAALLPRSLCAQFMQRTISERHFD